MKAVHPLTKAGLSSEGNADKAGLRSLPRRCEVQKPAAPPIRTVLSETTNSVTHLGGLAMPEWPSEQDAVVDDDEGAHSGSPSKMGEGASAVRHPMLQTSAANK